MWPSRASVSERFVIGAYCCSIPEAQCARARYRLPCCVPLPRNCLVAGPMTRASVTRETQWSKTRLRLAAGPKMRERLTRETRWSKTRHRLVAGPIPGESVTWGTRWTKTRLQERPVTCTTRSRRLGSHHRATTPSRARCGAPSLCLRRCAHPWLTTQPCPLRAQAAFFRLRRCSPPAAR